MTRKDGRRESDGQWVSTTTAPSCGGGQVREIKPSPPRGVHARPGVFVAPYSPTSAARPGGRDRSVVGHHSMRLGEAPYVNLAVPIEQFLGGKQELIAKGRAESRRPRRGSPLHARARRRGRDRRGCVAIGPARTAGFRPGDVIVRVNGALVSSQAEFYRRLGLVRSRRTCSSSRARGASRGDHRAPWTLTPPQDQRPVSGPDARRGHVPGARLIGPHPPVHPYTRPTASPASDGAGSPRLAWSSAPARAAAPSRAGYFRPPRTDRFQHSLGAMHLAAVSQQLAPVGQGRVSGRPVGGSPGGAVRMSGLLHDNRARTPRAFFDDNFLADFGLTHEIVGQRIIREQIADLIRGLKRSPSAPFEHGEAIDPDWTATSWEGPDAARGRAPRGLATEAATQRDLHRRQHGYVLRDRTCAEWPSGPSTSSDHLYSFFSEKGLTLDRGGIQASSCS